MAQNTPGKRYCKGMILQEHFRHFPDDAAAENMIVVAGVKGRETNDVAPDAVTMTPQVYQRAFERTAR